MSSENRQITQVIATDRQSKPKTVWKAADNETTTTVNVERLISKQKYLQ